MTSDLIKTILGSSVFVGLIGTVIGGVFKLWKNFRASQVAEDMDDAAWNAAFKRGAEKHIVKFDVPMVAAVHDLQSEVNQLRVQLGEKPKQFNDLPDPIPLFPEQPDRKSKGASDA